MACILQISYHILFFIDLYLNRTEEERSTFKKRFDFTSASILEDNSTSDSWRKALSKEESLIYLEEIKVKAEFF